MLVFWPNVSIVTQNVSILTKCSTKWPNPGGSIFTPCSPSGRPWGRNIRGFKSFSKCIIEYQISYNFLKWSRGSYQPYLFIHYHHHYLYHLFWKRSISFSWSFSPYGLWVLEQIQEIFQETLFSLLRCVRWQWTSRYSYFLSQDHRAIIELILIILKTV